MGINKVILEGKITEPESRYTPSGTAVMKFGVCVQRYWNYKETDIIDCVMWSKLAEKHIDHLEKGMDVVVEGWWEVEKGEKHKFQKCNVERIFYRRRKKDPE